MVRVCDDVGYEGSAMIGGRGVPEGRVCVDVPGDDRVW